MKTDAIMLEHTPERENVDARKSPKLDELPGEILGMIARFMTNEQLRRVRELYNRRITHHIDHVFVTFLLSNVIQSPALLHAQSF